MSLGSAEGTEQPDLGPQCWAEKGPCPSLDPCWPQAQLGWVPGIDPECSWNCDGTEGLRWRVGPPHAQRGCGWGRAVFPPQGLGWQHSQHIPVVTSQSPPTPVPLGLLWGESPGWSHPTQPSDSTVGFGGCQAPSPRRGKVSAARGGTPAPARHLRAHSWLREGFTAMEVKGKTPSLSHCPTKPRSRCATTACPQRAQPGVWPPVSLESVWSQISAHVCWVPNVNSCLFFPLYSLPESSGSGAGLCH